jgi:hypothetical protein
MLKLVRWNEDDAITHDPPRMRVTNLICPNLAELHLISWQLISACPNLTYLYDTIVADAQTCEIEWRRHTYDPPRIRIINLI